MRLVLDLQSGQTESRRRGTGRYSMALAKAMISEGTKHEFFVVLNHSFPETADSVRLALDSQLPAQNIMLFRLPVPLAGLDPSGWRCRTAELVREYFLEQLRPDFVHVLSLFEGLVDDAITSIGQFADLPTAVTLYDLTPLRYPGQILSHPLVNSWYLRKLGYLRRAQLLLAISEHSRREAIDVLGLPHDRVVNISADADPQFKVLELDEDSVLGIRTRYGLIHDFVMYVPAGFNFHKNIEGLMEAYSRLEAEVRTRHQLVVCCKMRDEERNQLLQLSSRFGLSKGEVVFTGYVSDADLVALYNLCKLFVFPSFAEGFGLPVLEAMRCGAPVIGSNSTSIPEVVGLDDALFDPTSLASMSSKLHQALTDEQFRQKLQSHGLIQAGRFSWMASAKRALEAIETVHERDQHAKRVPSAVAEATRTAGSAVSFLPPGQEDYVLQSARLVSAIAGLPTKKRPEDAELAELAQAIAESTIVHGPQQLLVDVSMLMDSENGTGIPRVARSILQQLLKQTPEGYRIETVYRSDGLYRYARRFMERFYSAERFGREDAPADVAPGDVFLGLHADWGLGKDESAKQWLRHHGQRGLKTYFVVYDLLPLIRTDWFQRDLCSAFEAWLPSIGCLSDGLVCISQTVANELRQWLDRHPVERQRPLRLGCFHLGADVEASLPTSGVSARDADVLAQLIDGTSLLMVGILWARKGHAQVLDAMENLWADGQHTRLVIVGRQGWSVESFVRRLRAHPERGKRLIWLDRASDELLLKLYRSASALVVASEGEGFGLPLVEAARHGLPIIVRDLPVFREIAGDKAFYFTGTSGQELANALMAWLNLYRRGKHPSSDGIRWLTWEESAQQLKKVLFEDQWLTSWQPDRASAGEKRINPPK